MNTEDIPIANRRRFCSVPNPRSWYPDLGFAGHDRFVTAGDPVLLTDPIYLADVYNETSDSIDVYLRRNGVFVLDFGGDASCPVFWKDPFLVLPTSVYQESAMVNSSSVQIDATRAVIGCDSGSLVFLVKNRNMRGELLRRIDSVVGRRNGILLDLPPGVYKVWLEQFEGYAQENMAGLYRNVVAERLQERSEEDGSILSVK